MSPALRKPSPRTTSAAISVGERPEFAEDCTGGGEAAGDAAFGPPCCGSRVGEATRGGSGNWADCVALDWAVKVAACCSIVSITGDGTSGGESARAGRAGSRTFACETDCSLV